MSCAKSFNPVTLASKMNERTFTHQSHFSWLPGNQFLTNLGNGKQSYRMIAEEHTTLRSLIVCKIVLNELH